MTTTQIKEYPIPLADELVRAILDGRKTQTRRVITIPQGGSPNPIVEVEPIKPLGIDCWRVSDGNGWNTIGCPYGKPGDRLWVREAWSDAYCLIGSSGRIRYRASGDRPACGKWSSSIHMPRWASRLTLEVTDVRVQRLQDISEADAKAEGAAIAVTERRCVSCGWRGAWDDAPFIKEDVAPCPNCGEETDSLYPDEQESGHVVGFRSLWESINGNGSWAANPWVWAITFRKLEGTPC